MRTHRSVGRSFVAGGGSSSGLAVLLLGLLLSACAGSGQPRPDADGGQVATAVSRPLALSHDGRTLWVANPDADSLTFLDVTNPAEPKAAQPLAVGGEPWAVAATPGGEIITMNRRTGTLSFVATGDGAGLGARVEDELYVGPEPGGLVLSASGEHAYVTLSADAAVAVVDIAAKQVVGHIAVGLMPWTVARSGDTLIVSHRLARQVAGSSTAANEGREGWLSLVDLSTETVTEVALVGSAFGFPNALEGLALAGDVVYVAHLLNSPEPPNDFQTTVSGGLSAVDLESAAPLAERSLHHNDPKFSTPVNFPRALAASPDGDTLYLALAGSDALMGVDISAPAAPKLLGFWPTGRNPRGVVIAPDGLTAYVMNYLSRDVSTLDLSDTGRRRELARVAVAPETLPAELLRGKVLFNNANDPRLSLNGWFSCASCHLDGGGDGTTWPREEGSRQTMPLWSLAGTAPFHAAGTRDEPQDFEIDIERFMRGVGLAPGAAPVLLGAPSAGASPDLDALGAFLLGGFRTPAAPTVDDVAAERGRLVFEERGCQTCHVGPAWTTSNLPGPPGTLAPEGEQVVAAVLHDVGTYDPSHDITGADGFDVPTLLGLAYTAPYFHDGSAATLLDVLAHQGHSGAPLGPADEADLASFLRSLDESAEPFALP